MHQRPPELSITIPGDEVLALIPEAPPALHADFFNSLNAPAARIRTPVKAPAPLLPIARSASYNGQSLPLAKPAVKLIRIEDDRELFELPLTRDEKAEQVRAAEKTRHSPREEKSLAPPPLILPPPAAANGNEHLFSHAETVQSLPIAQAYDHGAAAFQLAQTLSYASLTLPTESKLSLKAFDAGMVQAASFTQPAQATEVKRETPKWADHDEEHEHLKFQSGHYKDASGTYLAIHEETGSPTEKRIQYKVFNRDGSIRHKITEETREKYLSQAKITRIIPPTRQSASEAPTPVAKTASKPKPPYFTAEGQKRIKAYLEANPELDGSDYAKWRLMLPPDLRNVPIHVDMPEQPASTPKPKRSATRLFVARSKPIETTHTDQSGVWNAVRYTKTEEKTEANKKFKRETNRLTVFGYDGKPRYQLVTTKMRTETWSDVTPSELKVRV